eukprot:3845117-Alexandrium_andersonii.AAC.1
MTMRHSPLGSFRGQRRLSWPFRAASRSQSVAVSCVVSCCAVWHICVFWSCLRCVVVVVVVVAAVAAAAAAAGGGG